MNYDTALKGKNMGIGRKLRMGMVGGGPGAFIGEVHRKAARMDGKIEVVAGAFDIDPEKSLQMGRERLSERSIARRPGWTAK